MKGGREEGWREGGTEGGRGREGRREGTRAKPGNQLVIYRNIFHSSPVLNNTIVRNFYSHQG